MIPLRALTPFDPIHESNPNTGHFAVVTGRGNPTGVTVSPHGEPQNSAKTVWRHAARIGEINLVVLAVARQAFLLREGQHLIDGPILLVVGAHVKHLYT